MFVDLDIGISNEQTYQGKQGDQKPGLPEKIDLVLIMYNPISRKNTRQKTAPVHDRVQMGEIVH